jgi:methionyl aminopeptidase
MSEGKLDRLRRWAATLLGRQREVEDVHEDDGPVADHATDLERVRAAVARVAAATDDAIAKESRRLGPIVTEILRAAGRVAVPGATTQDVAEALARECRRRDLAPAMLGYRGFPAPAAISVNDEIVHGLPSSRALVAADLVKVELGVASGLAFASQSWTFAVGHADPSDEVLLVEGRRALRAAIDVVSPQHRVGDIGAAIQGVAEGAGLAVVRAFVGYGMGKSRIQPPQISGVGSPGTGTRLAAGSILNLHVIVKHGSPDVVIGDNRWTAHAEDGRRGALFTAMVEVTRDGHLELTGSVEP